MSFLLLLESINATWLSPGFSAWATEMTLAFVCGLGLFLLLLPCLPGEASSPPPGKKKAVTKGQPQMRRRRSRESKKSPTLKACRDCLKSLGEAQSLVFRMQSHLGTLPNKDSAHQPSKQDPPAEVCRRAPAGAQLHGEHAEPPKAALSPLTASLPPQASSPSSPGPKTASAPAGSTSPLPASQPPEPLLPRQGLWPQPLALSLPPATPRDPAACPRPPMCFSEPPLSQWDPTLLQTGVADAWKRPPSSPIPATPGSPISAAPWWQVVPRAWSLVASAQGKSGGRQLSCREAEASPPGDPRRWQVAGDPSSLSPDSQKLLEVKVTRKVEIQVWKEKENSGSFLEQTGPGNPFSSLTSVLNSLGAGQDTTSPLPFWDMEEKPQQLLGPQPLPCPRALGTCFQQRYSQLFWGLPSLHSESLVAAAWISQSPALPPSFFFNQISSVGPDQLQDKMSPLLPQAQPLSCLEPQTPSSVLSVPQFQPQALCPFHLQSSLQAPSCTPHVTDHGASQNKPQSLIPTEIQHPERPLIGEQLGPGWALPAVAHRSQEVYSLLTPSLSRDDWALSILPEDLPVSPELRRQLQQHIQKWLIRNRWDLPRRIQESLELMPFQDPLAKTCEAREEPCPERPCLCTGESSKDVQKVRFQLGRDVGKNLGHILGKVPKDAPRALENFPVKAQRENSVESERNRMGQLAGGSRDDVSKNQSLENTLRDHLGVKSGQISSGLIPLSVRQSWVSINSSLSSSDTQMETIHLATSKSWENCLSTSRKLPFLDSYTQQTLEAHVTKFWAKHRWRLPLQILKPVNIFKLKKHAPSGLMQLARPPSATRASGSSSAAEVAGTPFQTPRECLREKAIVRESSSTLECQLLTSSPAGEEVQGALAQGTSDGTECQSPQSSQTLTYSPKNRTVLEAKTGGLEAQTLPTRCATQDPQAEGTAKLQQKAEPSVCTTERGSSADRLLSPQPSRSRLLSSPVGDELASQVSADPKHQGLRRSQSKTFVQAHRDEGGRGSSPANHTERTEESGTSTLDQVDQEDTLEGDSAQHLPEESQTHSEGYLQRNLGRFLQWILPKKQVRERGDPPQLCQPEAAAAQSQRCSPHRSCVDPDVAEAQELMRAVGHMLERKGTLHQEHGAARWNPQELGARVPRFPCHRQPTLCLEQRTSLGYALLGYAAAPKGHSFPMRHRQLRGRKPPKTECLDSEQRGPRPPRLPLPHEALSPNRSIQPGPAGTRASDHPHHCPRHCPYRAGVTSGQPGNLSLVFSNRKKCLR